MTPTKRQQSPDELDDDTRRKLTQLLDWWDADPDALADAWAAHGDDLTAEYRQKHPGKRPPAWWHFETDLDGAPHAERGDIPSVDDFQEFRAKYVAGVSEQAAWLLEHDLLTDEEVAELERAVERVRGP